jgi:epsilon-lactone hydrolase
MPSPAMSQSTYFLINIKSGTDLNLEDRHGGVRPEWNGRVMLLPSREFEELRSSLIGLRTKGNTSLEEMRSAFEELVASYSPDLDGMSREEIVFSGIPASWITTRDAEEKRVALYLHAGPFTMGSFQSHLPLAGMISSSLAVRVLAIEYRQPPEHTLPAALDDCVAAYRWLINSGVDPKKLVIIGTAAGAGLAISTLLVLRDNKDPKPGSVVCLCPFVDMTLQGDSLHTNDGKDWINRSIVEEIVNGYLDGADPAEPLASPVFANLLGLPPIFIQASRQEILVDDARRLAAYASGDGVHVELDVWPDMLHLWQLFGAVLPEGREAIEKMARVVKTWVSAGAPSSRAH